MNHDIVSLNQKFSFQDDSNQLRIVLGEGDIPVVEIINDQASARISLQGAHLLSWIPKDEDEVLWLSEVASFKPGKSIRGGIPICWPWFGAHAKNENFPAHGFARTVMWDVVKTEALEDGRTRISFSLNLADYSEWWPYPTEVFYQITVGQTLELELDTCNKGSQAITIGQALHTYFNVADVSRVMLHGLDGAEYLDKMDGFNRYQQQGAVVFNQEVDRVYLDTVNDCVIQDTVLDRNIIIIKCGSHSTVVWNPWQKTADRMGDLGDEGYKRMLCVESSNAAQDVVVIEPGRQHQLWVKYEVQQVNK